MESAINRTFTFGTRKMTVTNEIVANNKLTDTYSILELVGVKGGKALAKRRFNGSIRLL